MEGGRDPMLYGRSILTEMIFEINTNISAKEGVAVVKVDNKNTPASSSMKNVLSKSHPYNVAILSLGLIGKIWLRKWKAKKEAA